MSSRIFDLKELQLDKKAFDKDGWLEFLNVPSLRCGLYNLPPNGTDSQGPHTQDEVYYVLEGAGTLVCDSGSEKNKVPVKAGSILFVKKNEKHHFENFQDGLKLLVFFSKVDESST